MSLTSTLTGDVVECGSYRGGSAAVIGQSLSAGRTLWVLDSFQGMPEVSQQDNFHKAGDFADTNAETVRGGLRQLGVQANVVPGFFSETLGRLPERISLAHIDCDLYEAVRDCLAAVYPRMERGGVILLDDYGAPTCEGAKQATDDFCSSSNEKLERLSQPSHGIWVGHPHGLREALLRCSGAALRAALR